MFSSISGVPYICCKCFIYRYCKDLGVAYICNGFFKCFSDVSDVCFNYFNRMLQLFYLNVAKVDCCMCCNRTHLPQLPVAAIGASLCVTVMHLWCASTGGARGFPCVFETEQRWETRGAGVGPRARRKQGCVVAGWD
jgi:hypothetical protein